MSLLLHSAVVVGGMSAVSGVPVIGDCSRRGRSAHILSVPNRTAPPTLCPFSVVVCVVSVTVVGAVGGVHGLLNGEEVLPGLLIQGVAEVAVRAHFVVSEIVEAYAFQFLLCLEEHQYSSCNFRLVKLEFGNAVVFGEEHVDRRNGISPSREHFVSWSIVEKSNIDFEDVWDEV